MRFIQKISLLGLLFLLPILSYAQDYVEGKSYNKLSQNIATQTGDKIEVLEFFWYGCPHCFKFEPTLTEWKKTIPSNVQFIRVPAPLNANWMVHTKTYYALETMGEGDKHHTAIFNAMHVKKMKLRDKESIANFLEKRGVDKAKFLSTFGSFAVEMRAKQAYQLAKQYKVEGVPMLAINGKYTISGQQAGSYKAMVDISDSLFKLETK
ncbi:Periplasmic thiol:disulfide interchange protein DsbA [hydrothermal vent metagenome]|uniref:Thiol:disulfide interchange protein DsbA n=1 Tax=hydrothermal vent metagenome TaxID=652676 RepID=A0A3B0XA21_9ZZZZ